ncbi:MAG TPA: BglII/BstYI family type II restriction endonuclease [Gemmatimonadaceae bacterium]|nr:BglII/BstYI family type II restriction endonuclease [Gemmatimonadaceae bacterium]
MRVVEVYSHLNGREHIVVHHPSVWHEIQQVIQGIDAAACRTKKSREARKARQGLLYSPVALNKAFHESLAALGWMEDRVSYWVTSDAELILQTLSMSPDEQRSAIFAAGKTPIFSYNQTDFVKDRIHIEVQFGKYAFVAYDLFVKHVAFFVGRKIDVGIEILPMKELQNAMSSGVPYYEAELYNLVRQGRSTPAVPLVLIGIAP